MKTPSIMTIAFGLVGVTAIVLFAIGPPGSSTLPVVPPAAPPPSSVTAAGFTLASTSVDLPADDQLYPDGPHADVINANCTSCHSASMALNQPSLSADQWKAEVTKMRDIYKAPVPAAAVPAVVSYLVNMSAKLPGAAKGNAEVPDSTARHDVSGASG